MKKPKLPEDCGNFVAIDWNRDEKVFSVHGYYDTKLIFHASFPATNIFDNPKAESLMELGAINTSSSNHDDHSHNSTILETKNRYLQTVYDQEPVIFDMSSLNAIRHAVAGITYLIENCDTRKGKEKIVINNHIKELQHWHRNYKIKKQLVGKRIKFFDEETFPSLTRKPEEDGTPIANKPKQEGPMNVASTLDIINNLDDVVSIEATTASGIKISYGTPSE